MPLTFMQESPLNRLFLAINHYVSTGDEAGTGMVLPSDDAVMRADGTPLPDDKLTIAIPVRITDDRDLDDFNAFRSRFDQLAPRFGLTLEPLQADGDMGVWGFAIRYRYCDALAEALTERPGPAGWGSCKPLIDEYFESGEWRRAESAPKPANAKPRALTDQPRHQETDAPPGVRAVPQLDPAREGRVFARGKFPPGLLDSVAHKMTSYMGDLAPEASEYVMYSHSEVGVRTQFFEAERVERLMQRRGWTAAKAVNYLALREGK
jgi:hypothetical protein